MPNNKEEMLNTLLLSLVDNKDDNTITDLLESAHKGFTVGANDFVEKPSSRRSPVDLKSNLRTYPVAQILISIIKYHELNKDTDVIRKTVLSLLDSLAGSSTQEPFVSLTADKILH